MRLLFGIWKLKKCYIFISAPPGSIENNRICITKGGQPTLRQNSDYGQLSEEMWNFLFRIYGGGPELVIKQTSFHSNSKLNESCSQGQTSQQSKQASRSNESSSQNSQSKTTSKQSLKDMAASSKKVAPKICEEDSRQRSVDSENSIKCASTASDADNDIKQEDPGKGTKAHTQNKTSENSSGDGDGGTMPVVNDSKVKVGDTNEKFTTEKSSGVQEVSLPSAAGDGDSAVNVHEMVQDLGTENEQNK